MKDKLQLYINGSWVDSEPEEVVINPAAFGTAMLDYDGKFVAPKKGNKEESGSDDSSSGSGSSSNGSSSSNSNSESSESSDDEEESTE